MTTLTYSLTRQQAADYLGVSTRTIDRYVVKGDLRYKKIANKVVLSQEDVERLHHDLELIQQATISGMPTSIESDISTESNTEIRRPSNDDFSWEWIKEFVDLLQEKDKTIEEKNQLIFWLQHTLWQLESRLQQVVALPDYTAEKNQLQTEMQKLEYQKTVLEEQVKREKLWNAVYMGLILIAWLVVALLVF